MFAFAGPIASDFLKRPEVEPLVKAAAFAVIGGGGLLTTIQAILVGYEMMSLRSITQVFWSVLRTAFSLLFILMGLGAFGAVLANSLALIVSGLVGLLLLFVVIRLGRFSAMVFNCRWELCSMAC
jgi:hypothetical protein